MITCSETKVAFSRAIDSARKADRFKSDCPSANGRIDYDEKRVLAEDRRRLRKEILGPDRVIVELRYGLEGNHKPKVLFPAFGG